MLAADQVHKDRDKKPKGEDPSKADSFASLNDHLFKDRLHRFKKATGQAVTAPSVKKATTKATSRNRSNFPEHCNIQRKFTDNSNIPRTCTDTRNDDAVGGAVRGTVYACNEAAEFRRRLQTSQHRQRLLATLACAEQERREAKCGYRLSSNGVLVSTRKTDIYENLDLFAPNTEDGNTSEALDSDDSVDEYKTNTIHEEDEQDEDGDFDGVPNKKPADASLDTHYKRAYLKPDKYHLCSPNTRNRLPKGNKRDAEEYSQDISGSQFKAYYIFDSADMECYDHGLGKSSFIPHDYIDHYKVQGKQLQQLTADTNHHLRITEGDNEKVRSTQVDTEKELYVPDLVTFEENVKTGAPQDESTKANTDDWLESTQERREPDTRPVTELLEDKANEDNICVLEHEDMRSITASQESETNKEVRCMLECPDKRFVSESLTIEESKEGTFSSQHQNTRVITESLGYEESTGGTFVLDLQGGKSVTESIELEEDSEVAYAWNHQTEVENNQELHTVYQEMRYTFESQDSFKVYQDVESDLLSEKYVDDKHKILWALESREICDECQEMRWTLESQIDAKHKQEIESILLSQGSVTENETAVYDLLSQDDFKEHQEAKCSSAVQVDTVGNLGVKCSSNVQANISSNPEVKCQEAKCSSNVQAHTFGNPEVKCQEAKSSSNVQADTFSNPEVRCQEAKCSSNVQADNFGNPEVKCQEAKCSSNVQADTFGNPEVRCQEAKCSSNVQADNFGNPEVKCQEAKCSSNVQADTFGNPEVRCQEAKCSSNVQADSAGNPEVRCQEAKCSSNVQADSAGNPEATCVLETCENVKGNNNTVLDIPGMKCMLVPRGDSGESGGAKCISGKHGGFEDKEDGTAPVNRIQNRVETKQNGECTSLPLKKFEEEQKEVHHKKDQHKIGHALHEDVEVNDDKQMWGEHEQVEHENLEYSTERSKYSHRSHEAKSTQKNVIVDDARNLVSCVQGRNVGREQCCDDEDASHVSYSDECDIASEDDATNERDLAHQLVCFKKFETGDRTFTSPYSKFQQCHEDLVKRLTNHSPDSLECDNRVDCRECDNEYSEQNEEDTEEDDCYDVQSGDPAALLSVDNADGRDTVPSDKVQKENKHVTIQQLNSFNLSIAPFESTLQGQFDAKSVYVCHNAMPDGAPYDDHRTSNAVGNNEVSADQDMHTYTISNEGNIDHMQADMSKEIGVLHYSERTVLPISSNTCHSREALKLHVINKRESQARPVPTGTLSDSSIVRDDIKANAAVYHVGDIFHSYKVENEDRVDPRDQEDNCIDNKDTADLGFVELEKWKNENQEEIKKNSTSISLPSDNKINDYINCRMSQISRTSSSIVGEASSENNSSPCSTRDSRNEAIKQNFSQTSCRSKCNSGNNSHPISDVSHKPNTDVGITPMCNNTTNPSDTDSESCDPSRDPSVVQHSKETFAASSDRHESLCNSMQESESHVSVVVCPVDLVNIDRTHQNYTEFFPHDNEHTLHCDSDNNKQYNDMLKQETIHLQDVTANKITKETFNDKGSMTKLTTAQEQRRACKNHTNYPEQTSLDSNVIYHIKDPEQPNLSSSYINHINDSEQTIVGSNIISDREHTNLGSDIINYVNDPEHTNFSSTIASISSLKDNNPQQIVENMALKVILHSQVNENCIGSTTVSKTATESFTELDFSCSSDCVVGSDPASDADMQVCACVNSTANTALCLASNNDTIEGFNQINRAVMFNTDLNGHKVSEHNKTHAPCHISDVVDIAKKWIYTSNICSEQALTNPAIYDQAASDNGIYLDGISTASTRGCPSSEIKQDQEEVLFDNETIDDISADDLDLLHQRLESGNPIAPSGDFTTTKSANNQETETRVSQLLCVQKKTCETMMKNVLRRAEKSQKVDNTTKTIPKLHAEKKDQCPLFCMVTGSKIEAIIKQTHSKAAYRSGTHNAFRGRKPMQQTQKPLVRQQGSRDNCRTMQNASKPVVNQLHENLNRGQPSKTFERICSQNNIERSQQATDVNTKPNQSKSMKKLHQCNGKRSLRNLTTDQSVKKSMLGQETINEKQSFINTPGNHENDLQYSGKYNDQLPDSKIPRRVKTGTFSGTNHRRGNKNANYSEVHDNVVPPSIGESDVRPPLPQQTHCAFIDHKDNCIYTNSDHDELIFAGDQSVCRNTTDLGTSTRGMNYKETRHSLLEDNQDILTQASAAENELNQDYTGEQYLYQINVVGGKSADGYVDNDSGLSADAKGKVLTQNLTNYVSVNNNHQLLQEQFCCHDSCNLKNVSNQDGTNQPRQSFRETDRPVSVKQSSITQQHQILCETDRPVSVKQSPITQPQIPYETDRSEYVKQCSITKPHQILTETDRSVSVKQSLQPITQPIRNKQITNLSIYSPCSSQTKPMDCHDEQFKHRVEDKHVSWGISKHNECSSVGFHLIDNNQDLCWNNQTNQLATMPAKGETVANLSNDTSTINDAREQLSTVVNGNVSLYVSYGVGTILNNTDATWDNARPGGKPTEYASCNKNIITSVSEEQLGECITNDDMHEVNSDKVNNMSVSKTPASETVTFRNMVKIWMNHDEEFSSDDDASVFISDSRKRNELVLPISPLGNRIGNCEREGPYTLIDRDPQKENTAQVNSTDDHFQKLPSFEAVTCSGERDQPSYAELKARALAKALPVLTSLKLQSRRYMQIDAIANDLSCDSVVERTTSGSPLVHGSVKEISLKYNSGTGAVFANDYFEESDMSNSGKFVKNEPYYNRFTGFNINNSKSDQGIDRDNDSTGTGQDNSGDNSIMCDIDKMKLEQKDIAAVITKEQTNVHQRSNVGKRTVHRKCRIPVRQSNRTCVLPEEVEIPYDKHVKQPRNIVMVLKSKNKSKGDVAAALSLVQPPHSNVSSATDSKHVTKLPKYVHVFTKGSNVVVEVCADPSSTADSVSNIEQVRAPLAERIKKYQQGRPRNIFAGRNHAQEESALEGASKRSKKISVDISSCSEVSSIVSNSHQQTCEQFGKSVNPEQATKYVSHEQATKYVNHEQATKYVNHEQATKYVNHEQATKYVNHEQATKYVSHEQATKSVNYEQATKYVNHEQATKYVNHEQATKYVNHEQATKYVNHEQATKYVNHEQATKCVNHEQATKSVNHEQAIKYVNHEQATKCVNHEQDTKYVNHEQATKCVNHEQVNGSLNPCIRKEKTRESDTSTPRSSKTFNVSNDEDTLFSTGSKETLPVTEYAASQDDVAIQTSDNTLASAVTVQMTHLTIQKKDASEQVSFPSGNNSNSGGEELNANAAVAESKSLGEKDGNCAESKLKSAENPSIPASITKASTSLSASPKRYLKKNVAFRSKPLETKANAECTKTHRHNSGTDVDKHTVDAVHRRYQGTLETSTKTENTNIRRQQRYRKLERPAPVEQTVQQTSSDLMSNCQLFSPSSHESNELSSQQGAEIALESHKSLCVNIQHFENHQKNRQSNTRNSNKIDDQDAHKQHTVLDSTESDRDATFLDLEDKKIRSVFNHEVGLQNKGCLPVSKSTRIEESKLCDTDSSRSLCSRAENSLVPLENITPGSRAGSSRCQLSGPKQLQQTEWAVRNQNALLENMESTCSVKTIECAISLPDIYKRRANDSLLRLTDSSALNVEACAHTEYIPDSGPTRKQIMNNDCVSRDESYPPVFIKKTGADYNGIPNTQLMNETEKLTETGNYETLALDRAAGDPCNISVADCTSPIEGDAIKPHKLSASNSCDVLPEEILLNDSNIATRACNKGIMLATFNKQKESFFNPIPATVSPSASKKHRKTKSLLLKSIAFTAEDSSSKSSLRSNENGNAHVYVATRRSDSCNPLSIFRNDSPRSLVNNINLTPDICLSGGALPVGNRPTASIEWQTDTSVNQTLHTFENDEHTQVYRPPSDSEVLSRRSANKTNKTPILSGSKNNLSLSAGMHPHTSHRSATQVKILETISTSPEIVNAGRLSESVGTPHDTQSLSLLIKRDGKQTAAEIKPNNYKHDAKIKISNTQELIPLRRDLHSPHKSRITPTARQHHGMTTPRKGTITFTSLEMKAFDEHSPGVINSCESLSYTTTSQESTAETHVCSSHENVPVLAGPTTSNDAEQTSPISASSANRKQSSRASEDVIKSVQPKLPPLSSRQSGLPHRPQFKRYY